MPQTSRSILKSSLAILFAGGMLALTAPVAQAALALDWTTAYTQVNGTTNQLRSLALATQAGNDSVYAGFIQTTGNRDIYRFDTNSPYTQLNTRGLSGDQPKAIATDDRGNVYVGNRISGGNSGKITVHNASLSTSTSFNTPAADFPDLQFGGLALSVIGGDYYLYASRESGGEVRRYNANNPAAITLDTTFGISGVFVVPGSAGVLRGLTVDGSGNIFVTSREDNKIYRVSADLSTTISQTVTRAMDVALYGGEAYVTSYNSTSSVIKAFNATSLAFNQDITAGTLNGGAYSRAATEGWAGIDIDSTGRIWLTDQQFAGSGATTADRLLVSSPVPEPATIALLLPLAGLAIRRRRAI